MNDPTLKIGISSGYFHHDPERALFKGKRLAYIEESLSTWLQNHHALPLLIPMIPNLSEDLTHRWVSQLDGLILSGGDDVCPKSYQETALKPEWEGDLVRDQYETHLIHAFRAERKPIFGLCRGIQILNVALGGTLYQDIGTQVPESLIHRNWDIYDQNFHPLEIQEGSWLSSLYPNSGQLTANSVHHHQHWL